MKRMSAKQFAYFLIGAIALICILSATSCVTTKQRTSTRDSIVVKTHDSLILKYITKTRDSVIIKDTAIGFSAEDFGFEIDHNSTTDTVVKKGKLTIRRTVNNGIETIHCNSDSLTILVTDLRVIISDKNSVIDQQQARISELATSHSELVVKEKQVSWFGRLLNYAKNLFMIIGIIYVVVKLFKLVKRFI